MSTTFKLLASLILAIGCTFGLTHIAAVKHSRAARAAASPVQIATKAAMHDVPVRQVYGYSVVPGGLRSKAEMEQSIAENPDLQRHYSGIQVARIHMVQLPEPMFAYVSYRKETKLLWTKKPIAIPTGEAVLSDGTHLVRVRCGNRISKTAMKPVSADEPPPSEFARHSPFYPIEPRLLASLPPTLSISSYQPAPLENSQVADLIQPVPEPPIAFGQAFPLLQVPPGSLFVFPPSGPQHGQGPLGPPIVPPSGPPVVGPPIFPPSGPPIVGPPEFPPVGPPVVPPIAPVPEPVPLELVSVGIGILLRVIRKR
jgi:hypothetical protein